VRVATRLPGATYVRTVRYQAAPKLLLAASRLGDPALPSV
jgi:hypothetical protein